MTCRSRQGRVMADSLKLRRGLLVSATVAADGATRIVTAGSDPGTAAALRRLIDKLQGQAAFLERLPAEAP